MSPFGSKARRAAIEEAMATLKERVDALEHALADSAPATEVERLNHAFDLIAASVPISEIERLDQAFNLIAQLYEQISGRAPASEVARLDHAFELIADRAPASEIARLNDAIELIANHRASERVVEVPWVLSKYGGEARVLEVGYAFAEEHYLKCLVGLRIPLLIGIDAARSPRPESFLGFHQVQGDILKPCFRPHSFDLVLCVSTIEHIGRDNTRYGLDAGRSKPHPDHDAIKVIATWLAPAGRLLLTVPFGRFEDHGWLINYDADHLDALIKASGLDVEEKAFFGWQPGGWREVEADTLTDRGYQSLGAAHAAGVALVEMRRGGTA
jgi:O-antigen chain-terminating methyltransferase